MRTGDAEIEFWLESEHSERSYCVTVSSRRRGRYGSKQWETATYVLNVEQWEGEEPTGIEVVGREIRTLSEALRLGRREADRLEGEARGLVKRRNK